MTAAIEIYPVDPDCPRVKKVRTEVLGLILKNRKPVRTLMEEFVAHHATVCPRCLAYNAAKGEIDG